MGIDCDYSAFNCEIVFNAHDKLVHCIYMPIKYEVKASDTCFSPRNKSIGLIYT